MGALVGGLTLAVIILVVVATIYWINSVSSNEVITLKAKIGSLKKENAKIVAKLHEVTNERNLLAMSVRYGLPMPSVQSYEIEQQQALAKIEKEMKENNGS